MRKHFKPCTIELQPGHRGIPRIRTLADIAWCTYWHIEHAVWPHTDKLPTMICVTRITVINHNGWRGLGEVRFDVVVAQDAVHFGYVQGASVEGHTVRHL